MITLWLCRNCPKVRIAGSRPDPIGPIIDIFPEGSFVPIFGRDQNSEWKLSRSMGVPCYLWLENDKINKALMQYSGPVWQAQDLEFYPQPAPCPKPDPKPGPGPGPASQATCSDYSDAISCRDAGCNWFQVNDKLYLCVPYQ